MGSCCGKGAVKAGDPAQQAIEIERRRLSLNNRNSDPVINPSPQSGPVGGQATTPGEGVVLDLFPQAVRVASVCGSVSEVQQNGYADKKTDNRGYASEESGLGQRIGYACKKGLKPESPNQDDFCIFRADATSIYAVFDGHGPYGHDISSFVQEALPRVFAQSPKFKEDPEEALGEAFPEAHRLCTQSHDARFDCTLSGTTATMAMLRDGYLYLAHVGDSRAVLARSVEDSEGGGGVLRHEDLTVDHKPTCEGERQRIQHAGGQVRRLEGDIPHRVFLAGKMYPGLAMTRSIGDTVGATAGVTSVPEVTSRKVEKDWRFLLLCSDGIWEFIDSQEAVDIVGKHSPISAHAAAEDLAAEAWRRWIKEEGNVVDDITVILAWFTDD